MSEPDGKWSKLTIAEGIELHVSDAALLSPETVRRLAEAVRAALRDGQSAAAASRASACADAHMIISLCGPVLDPDNLGRGATYFTPLDPPSPPGQLPEIPPFLRRAPSEEPPGSPD